MSEQLAQLEKLGGGGTVTKETLIWSNPSPTSNFGAQTISLDLSDAKAIAIQSRAWLNDPTLSDKVCAIVGDVGFEVRIYVQTSGIMYYRDAKASKTGVQFSVGSGNGTVAGCVPMYIWKYT